MNVLRNFTSLRQSTRSFVEAFGLQPTRAAKDLKKEDKIIKYSVMFNNSNVLKYNSLYQISVDNTNAGQEFTNLPTFSRFHGLNLRNPSP